MPKKRFWRQKRWWRQKKFWHQKSFWHQQIFWHRKIFFKTFLSNKYFWHPFCFLNFLEGAKHLEGIAIRLAGVKVWVDVSYYNSFLHSVSGWNGPVAIIRIKNTASPAWVSRPTMHVLDIHGSKRLRYTHGIQVQLSSSGAFAWISTDKVIGLVTSILVH